MSANKKQSDSVNEPNPEVYQLTEKSNVYKILEMARNLSKAERGQLKKELDLMSKDEVDQVGKNFSSFILSGPLMTDTQLDEFSTQRENFNKWRIK